MKPTIHPAIRLGRIAAPAPITYLKVLASIAFVWVAPTHAQTTTPAPTPADESTPQITVTPGVPSGGDIAAYKAARTPLASVVLGTPGITASPTTSTAKAQTLAAINTVQPVASGGVFTQIDLSAAVTRPTKGRTSAVGGASGSLPALATVTLTYTADRAGEAIWVQPLNGGTVSVVDDSGKTIVSTDGFMLEIGTASVISFCFQAPAVSNTYQVLTRLDNVPTVLDFLVPDPNS